MPRSPSAIVLLLLVVAALAAFRAPSLGASPGDRLAYIDERAPFYVHEGFPKLTTPMWVGDDGVDAVVVLSIDDLTTERSATYRDFLAPVLARLAELQGSSPLDIFANRVDPSHEQVRPWLESGVRLEVHTRTHPCPLMQRGLEGAAGEVLDCLDNLNDVEGHRAIAYRMPCCDSINSATPRFFSELLTRRSPSGGFLEVDSSICVFPEPSYRAYAPFERYATTVDDYLYPFVVGGLVWELPIVVPTDWQAQHRRGPFHPDTVADIERGIDIAVERRGLYTFCFHPHGWIRSAQLVEIIDHVHRTHGARVRFLTMRDVLERLTANVLGGTPLRGAGGAWSGARLLDVDADGFLDAVVANEESRVTRLWRPAERRWEERAFPLRLVAKREDGATRPTGVRFGVLHASGRASALVLNESTRALAHFDGAEWVAAPPEALAVLVEDDVETARDGVDRGARLRDVDGDGLSDLVVNNEGQNAVYRWSAERGAFERHAAKLPALACLVDAAGRDRGVRFHDLDRDGRTDVICSNDDEYFAYTFDTSTSSWTRRVLHGPVGAGGALPPFVSDGADRGAWIRDGVLYVANEDTVGMPNHVDVRRLDFLIEHRADPPLDPKAALATFSVPEGFRVELVAAEPDVLDPVSIEFGPDGRIWVAEMASYPRGLGADADGRVRVLRDDDGDGIVDRSTVFARGLGFPTGALPYGRGALVTRAPDILYLEDADGDDRADASRVVFTGFGEDNHQHRVNGLHFAIDNCFYGANGDSGGDVRALLEPERAPVSIRGRDFRFTLSLGGLEAVTGRTQFGLALDDFGNRFGTSNARHILHAVLEERAVKRNPHVATPALVRDIPDHGAMARIFQTSRQLLSLNAIHVPGHFSSACGIAIYRDERFPPAYRGNAFVCEPVGNIVHRDVLVPNGATFTATRAPEDAGREFLASTDSWFRPVFATTGPDGALWIADMHRWVIEHPQYIPDEIQQILDFTAGRDRGRIYRVVFDGEGETDNARARASAPPRLDGLSSAALVAQLDSGSGWRRDTAQRLLVERGDRAAVDALRALARDGARSATRAHALWTLEGLGALDDATLARAFDDTDSRVREQALRMVGQHVGGLAPAIAELVLATAGDDDVRVRIAAALALGDIDDGRAADALATLLGRDGADEWMRAAVLSSCRRHGPRVLSRLLAGARVDAAWFAEAVGGLIATIARDGDPARVDALLAEIGVAPSVERWHVALVATLGEARGAAFEAEQRAIARDPARREALAGLERVRAYARRVASDGAQPESERVEAVRALGASLALDRELALALLSLQQPLAVQLAAVATFRRAPPIARPEAMSLVPRAWRDAGPALRREMLEVLLSSSDGRRTLLDAVEREAIPADALDAAARERLLASAGASLRMRAETLLERRVPEARRVVLERYAAAADTREADPGRGREVFREHCSSCHRLDGIGHRVGPDLAEARAKGPAALLEAVLDPGRMVPPRYRPYTVVLANGTATTGIIAEESGTSITLARADGVEETVLRADIAQLAASTTSLMPAELETAISPDDMAHLLAFLRLEPLDLDALDPTAVAAARAQTIEDSHDGLAAVLRATNRERQASFAGAVEMRFVRQLDGSHELLWRTEPTPHARPTGGRAAFRLPVAMGYHSQPSGHFTLFVNGEEALRFDVTLESERWQSDDGRFTLHYTVRARNREDSTGIAELEVPAELIDGATPLELRVTGSATNSRRWFGVLPLR